MEQTDTNQVNEVKTSNSKELKLRVNPWWLSMVLALGLLVVVVLWRPWDAAPSATDRTISVSGSSTVKAEPDEYVFYPSYDFQNTDKATGLKDLTAKSDEVVAGLEKVGVADKDLKTNASGYRDYYFYNEETKMHTYTLSVTATVRSRDMAQKVQDYLLTTDPSGAVTPQATFSTAKQKELEAKGRDAATKEARSKAEQQAKNLGFKVGKVKNVSDSGSGYGGVQPMLAMGSAEVTDGAAKTLAVQPGENELSYTVQVTYFIR
ncbi:SIMPL domain-containing protein [Candidatus Saccharibacteria bacterium]|nr:SIMPL domain-containing protein [Candidatus Saccharibacteria bacterium]